MKRPLITKKDINYYNNRVYAIYYSDIKTVYYNIDCKGAKIIVFKP